MLGSGSWGNSTAVFLEAGGEGTRTVLIDCGLSPRATASRLAPLGVSIDDIDAILLTHLDGDHFHPGWSRRIRRHAIRVHLHERHRRRAGREGIDARHALVFRGRFSLGDGADADPILLAHDTLGTVGFVIETADARLGYATDLGRVPPALTERFTGLDALAIESNYDPDLERSSPRPAFLKERIMGGGGHLSNEESLNTVLAIDAQSQLAHVVALHLSQECNDPRIVERLYARCAVHLLGRLTISSQHRPTPLLAVPADAPARVRRGGQMAMF